MIAGETFNAGYENHTVAELALLVKEVVEQEFPEKAPIRIERPGRRTTTAPITSPRARSPSSWATAASGRCEDAVRDLCRRSRRVSFPTA